MECPRFVLLADSGIPFSVFNMKKEKVEELIAKGYDIDIEQAFRNGWEMFKVLPLYSMLYGIFIISLQVLFAFYLSDIAFVFTVFLAGPLYAGFFLVANKISRNVEVTYPDFFTGFQYYMPVMLVWVIGQVIAGLGLLLVLPGIYLMVGYMFAVLMSIFGGFDFWNSLEYSRKLIHIRWWKFFLLALCLVILNIIGAMLLIVGLIVTIPLTFYVIYCLFEGVTQETLVD